MEKEKLMNIDLEKETNFILSPFQKIDNEISALSQLKKSKISEGQLISFHKDCRKCFVTSIKKLREHSSLTYELTRAVSCFNPLVALNQTLFDKILSKLLLILTDKNWLSPITADRAKIF